MPSPLARLDGDITRLARESCRHMAPSTSRPSLASASPYGRGSAWGSLTATPWAITGGGTDEPHPAMSIAASARPAAPRSWFFMRIRRRRTPVRLRADDHAEVTLLDSAIIGSWRGQHDLGRGGRRDALPVHRAEHG